MDEYEFAMLAIILPGLVILGGFGVVVAAITRGGKMAEFRHKERMAMIERGMAPSERERADPDQRSHGFKMSLGILLCGLGLAFVMLLTFAAGSPSTGFGVGGAFVMIGLAFVVSALFTKKDADGPPPAPRPPLT